MRTQMLTSRLGGELVSFKINGEEKIHQGADVLDENGKVYWKRHSPVLFPIVGKLKKNQTLIGGRTYEMRQHGFARDMEFEPITKLDNFHSYVLKSNPSTLARYPYDFELYNTYRLVGNKLTTMYRVINTGLIAMPFGIGGHPAFKIDANELKSGNYYLEFEENEEKINNVMNDFDSGEFSLSIIYKALENYNNKYNLNLNIEDFALTISKYAGIKDKNGNLIADETIAEAIHDYYLHKENMKNSSYEIIQVIKQKL